ncbi:MAG TPA: hypothetical protein VEO00_13660 [Actinomycetota bacterium]|nr:hypothetical protein [Actinomycetota bacterium]
MKERRIPAPRVALLVALALAAAACSSGGGSAETSPSVSGPGGEFSAQVASFDLSADRPQRLMVGILTSENAFVAFGRVTFRFAYLGTRENPVDPPEAVGTPVEATFLPLVGTNPADVADGPRPIRSSEGPGVYEIRDHRFDRAGFWQVEVAADVRGLGPQRATAAFEVLEHPAVPAPGDEALPTENHTIGEKGIAPEAIDSRAATGTIPDPELHRYTIKGAIAASLPAVVVFSTPVYCVSRFCGPVTDAVQALAARYGDRAVFIHVEIWRDFQGQTVNEAAADWLLRNDNLNEPWVFLIGADGVIVDRWDNLLDEDELEAQLRDLPPGAVT